MQILWKRLTELTVTKLLRLQKKTNVEVNNAVVPLRNVEQLKHSHNNDAAPTSVATAGNATITAAQVLSGIYVRDCAGAGRTDTLPTAALLVAAMASPKIGDILTVHVVNGSDGAEALTIGAGTGGGFDTNQIAASRVVAQNASKDIRIRITGVATPAYVVYA